MTLSLDLPAHVYILLGRGHAIDMASKPPLQLVGPEEGQRRYVVYGLVDPEDKTLRYVGSTAWPELRKLDHTVSSVGTATEKTPLGRWVLSLRKRGLVPEVVEMEVFDDEDEMQTAERFWIMHHREIGTDLLNVLDGSPMKTVYVGIYPPERTLTPDSNHRRLGGRARMRAIGGCDGKRPRE